LKNSFKIFSRKISRTILFTVIILNILPAKDDPTVGLIYNDNTQSYSGYTLFAPNTSKFTYLIDNEGRLVHQWESEYVPGLSAYLLEDGHLLRSAAIESADPGVSITGGFQKINWDGDVIWEYYYGTQHHDIEAMPNGNVLMVVNDRQTKNAAIQAGRDPSLIDGANIRSLSILEIVYTGPTTGNIVWQWNAWEHLIQDFDNTKDNFGVVAEHPELMDINFAKDGGQDWLHTNSVAYNVDLDQILVSNRNTNEIWIIDHSPTPANSDLLYRWGNPIAYGAGTADDQKLHGQHDAHWVASGLSGDGNILIFNNGFSERGYSSADEMVPPINGNGTYELVVGSAYTPTDLLWSYTAPEPTDFNSPRYGGTQRLPNENTLICNSDRGEFIEVNSSKEIVWRYISPVTANGILEQGTVTMDSLGNWIPNNQVFRCYKYGEDYPGLAGKTLTSGEPLKINDDLNEVTNFKLYNNYPNPFNPTTNIEFVIPEQEFVKITVFDILGNEVKTLLNQTVEPGQYSITWDSRNDNGRLLGSGIFFYTVQAGQFNQTKKMMLLR
jgi:hypothetical protein